MFKRFCGRQDQVQAFVLQPEMLRNTEKDSVANPGPAVLQLVVEMVAKLRGEALDLPEEMEIKETDLQLRALRRRTCE